MFRRRFSIFFLLTLLVLSLPAPAAADWTVDLAADFRPAAGVVIMPAEGEFLVDLDAAKGVRVGDLLAVVKPGEQIVHPVTKEVLGDLAEVKGVLQVTRVKSGYSYASPVGTAKEIGRGDAVRRFDKVPAVFRSSGPDGQEVYEQVTAALPFLDWRGYQPNGESAPQAVPLVFLLRDGRLEVQGPQGTTLHQYAIRPAAPNAADNAGSLPAATPPAVVLAAPPAAASEGEVSSSPIVRRQSAAAGGIVYSPEFAGEVVGLSVGDFDGDGRLEIATVFPHRLEIGRLADGTFTTVSQLELGVGRKVVRVDEADLDGNGRAELFLTTVVNGELQSLVVDASSGTPTVRWEKLPWFFGTVDIPGEGKVLFGQTMGTGEVDFAGNPFRVVLQGKELAAGASLELPWKVDLYGISLLEPAEGQKLIVDFNIFDQLKVMRFSGEEIWQSSDSLGGGEAFIERQDTGKSQVNGSATRHLFLPARLAHGLDGELLVPANEGVRAFSRLREFKESRLQGMKWNGFALEEVWHTRPQEAYLADFRLADADNDGQLEIVQALVFSHKGFLSKGRSAVAVFEIQ